MQVTFLALFNDDTLFKLTPAEFIVHCKDSWVRRYKLPDGISCQYIQEQNLNHVFNTHVGKADWAVWLADYTRPTISCYPPYLRGSAISASVSSSPESPTIFTRLGRALTFLNEKALFPALQQLTIYDNEASLES